MNSSSRIFAISCALTLSTHFAISAEEIKPGDPIEYQPFSPERWKEKKQSTLMHPWEGERTVLLTTRADFDGETMGQILARLDDGWQLYAELIGKSPAPFRNHNGKVTFAAVPDPSYTCGMGCGMVGSTGIEIGGFYSGDYDLVAKNPKAFPHYYFYEMGRNYYLFGEQMNSFGTGFAVFMRTVCMETLKCEDPDQHFHKFLVSVESKLKDAKVPFLRAFTLCELSEKEWRLKDPLCSDQPVLYASAMLKLRRDYGGNDWVKRFYHYLPQCPPGGNVAEDDAKAQSLNWLVAASCAARQDLSGLFADRWNMEIGEKSRAALGEVDWKSDELSPHAIIASLPADELPLTLAINMPGFITAERRKANLLVDGSFDVKSKGRWEAASWKQNKSAAATDERQKHHGQRSLKIRSPEADDARYVQKVAVKPNTRYLLCGWIKTINVVVVEKGGQTGANLSLDGGYELTRSLIGTHDWTYVTLVFDSAQRTEVTVCARLGFYSSTAKGTAWFDDLCLVELSKP